MTDETNMRKEFKKASNDLISFTQQYDVDITNYTIDNQKSMAEYDDTLADLKAIKEDYDMRVEEKRKRDEIAAIMQLKNDMQKAKMEKLERATEYM